MWNLEFVNPSSYDAVEKAMNFIGKEAGIEQYGTGEHKFLTVVCDGLPYNLRAGIIHCAYFCICGFQAVGNTNIQKHEEEQENPQNHECMNVTRNLVGFYYNPGQVI